MFLLDFTTAFFFSALRFPLIVKKKNKKTKLQAFSIVSFEITCISPPYVLALWIKIKQKQKQQINEKEEKEITGQYLWWLTMCGCACEKYNFYNQIKFDIF